MGLSDSFYSHFIFLDSFDSFLRANQRMMIAHIYDMFFLATVSIALLGKSIEVYFSTIRHYHGPLVNYLLVAIILYILIRNNANLFANLFTNLPQSDAFNWFANFLPRWWRGAEERSTDNVIHLCCRSSSRSARRSLKTSKHMRGCKSEGLVEDIWSIHRST